MNQAHPLAMGQAESALRDAVADVDVAVAEAVDSLRGSVLARQMVGFTPSDTHFYRVKAAREKTWRATGVVALRDQQLRSLPPTLFELGASVKSLDATGNRLSSLPDELSALTAVQRIVLSQNALSTVPGSLCALTTLKLLVMDGNALTQLPAELGQLKKLEKLSVAGNKLTALPEALGQLQSLKSLTVSGNALTSLPDALGSCACLEEIDASRNALACLPVSLGRLARLRSLLLDGNRIATLPGEVLQGCTSLATLSLHDNPIDIVAMEQVPGWLDMQSRIQGKNAKRVAGGVLLGDKGLDDGLDHSLTRVVVPHT